MEEMREAASYTTLMLVLCRSGRIGKAASPNGVRRFPTQNRRAYVYDI